MKDSYKSIPKAYSVVVPTSVLMAAPEDIFMVASKDVPKSAPDTLLNDTSKDI